MHVMGSYVSYITIRSVGIYVQYVVICFGCIDVSCVDIRDCRRFDGIYASRVGIRVVG